MNCRQDMTYASPDRSPYLNIQTDYGFKWVFGKIEHKGVLIKFLNAILGDELTVLDVRYQDKEILPSEEKGKRIIYDVYCRTKVEYRQTGETSGVRSGRGDAEHHFILEMQNIYELPFEERMLYYVSKAVSDQGKAGWDYSLEPVIAVAVTDFDMPGLDKAILHDMGVRDKRTGELLTDKLRMLFLSLPQVPRQWSDCKTEIERWLFLIKNMEKMDKNSEAYREGNYSEMFDAASNNLAGEELVEYSRSLDRLRAYQSGVAYAAEKAEEKGFERGIRLGEERGIRLGEERGKFKSVKKMIGLGLDNDMISQISGMTESEIDAIRNAGV